MGRRQVQLGLALPAPVVVVKLGWGGARKGAGRKKVSEQQSHRMREAFSKRMPVHLTMKMAKNVKGLRGRRMYKAVEAALWAAARNEDGLLCDFSVQNDHLHVVIDAANNKARQGDAMRSAVSGLAIRVVKAINSLCRRKGRVFDDRDHARVLRTPTEVRRVRHYVRDNFRKHLRERLQTERTQAEAAWISVGVDHRQALRLILQSTVWIDPCSSQAARADGGTWQSGDVGCCQWRRMAVRQALVRRGVHREFGYLGSGCWLTYGVTSSHENAVCARAERTFTLQT